MRFGDRSAGMWKNLTNIFQMGWNHQLEEWNPSLNPLNIAMIRHNFSASSPTSRAGGCFFCFHGFRNGGGLALVFRRCLRCLRQLRPRPKHLQQRKLQSIRPRHLCGLLMLLLCHLCTSRMGWMVSSAEVAGGTLQILGKWFSGIGIHIYIIILPGPWWFQIFFIFTPKWGNDTVWLIFFSWVETTT